MSQPNGELPMSHEGSDIDESSTGSRLHEAMIEIKGGEAKNAVYRKAFETFYPVWSINNEIAQAKRREEELLRPVETDSGQDLVDKSIQAREAHAQAVELEGRLDDIEHQWNEWDAYGAVLNESQSTSALMDAMPQASETEVDEIKAGAEAELNKDIDTLYGFVEEVKAADAESEEGRSVEMRMNELTNQFVDKYGLNPEERENLLEELAKQFEELPEVTHPKNEDVIEPTDDDEPTPNEDAPESDIETKEDASEADVKLAYLEEIMKKMAEQDDEWRDQFDKYQRQFGIEPPAPVEPEPRDDEPVIPFPPEGEQPSPVITAIGANEKRTVRERLQDMRSNLSDRFNDFRFYLRNPKMIPGAMMDGYHGYMRRIRGHEGKETQRKTIIGTAIGATAVIGAGVAAWYWLGMSPQGDETSHADMMSRGSDGIDRPGLSGLDESPEIPDFSADARTVQYGEGWLSTLDQMGIPESERSAMLEKILDSNDPAIREWVYEMPDGNPGIAKAGQLPQSVLEKIAQLRG